MNVQVLVLFPKKTLSHCCDVTLAPTMRYLAISYKWTHS